MSFRSIYPRNKVTALSSSDMMTVQSAKKECDIHNILKQYKKTGMISHVSAELPAFKDLPDNIDYQQALEIVREAENSFADLPAKVRDYFDNNPSKLLASLGDPAQRPILEDLGVLVPAPGTGPIPQPTGAPAPVGTTSPAAPPAGVV